MDKESKSKLDKSLEKATGLKRVELATSGKSPVEREVSPFVKPVFLQDPDYKDTKGAILVYNSAGERLMQPFYNLVISGSQYAIADRVSRTATMDGEKRRFLGSAPVRVAFAIGLLDYKNHPWKDQFIYLWNNVFRGTVLQENDASVYVYCAGDIFVGDLHACQISRAAENDGAIMASISMDCNRPPIPANTAFTGKDFTLDSVLDYAVKEVIQSGVRVEKSTWRPD